MTGTLSAVSLAFVCAALAGGCTTGGIDHGAGAWGQVFAQGDLGRATPSLKGVRWWFDAHARYADKGPETTIVRPGLGYAVAEGSTVWLGYAWIREWFGGGGDVDEHRIWQQFLWTRSLDRFGLQSRTRLEQRFLETGDDVGWRLRQLVRADYPFEASKLRLIGWDELFFDLNSTDWGANSGFRQNRLFAGVGWELDQSRTWRLEAGYLNQYLHRSSRPDGMNHILSLNFIGNY